MNWIDSHSQVDEGVTFGSCRIIRLLFAVNWVLLASSQQGLPCTRSAAGDRTGMKISTKNTEVLCLSTNPRQCMRQVSGNTLHQVEEFKYLGVVFTSDKRWSEEIDARFGQANAVLREFYRSVVTKREHSDTAKLSVIESVFVPVLTYGHQSWVLKEYHLRWKWQRWDFCEESPLWLWHFATKCAAVKFAKPWMSNHFSELRDRRYVGSAMCPECPTKTGDPGAG